MTQSMETTVTVMPSPPKPRLKPVRSFLLVAAFSGALLSGAGSAEETLTLNVPEPPEQVVERLEQTLIDNMRLAPELDYAARYQRLRPLIGDIMAVERMARFVFGRDWRQFDPDLRQAFSEAFLDLSAATFANQFDNYNGEFFSAVAVQRQAEDRALVRRMLTSGKGRKIAFDYLMTPDDGQWRIVTIITDGVSDLALKRSQYRRILEREDFAAVVEHVREQTARQAAN